MALNDMSVSHFNDISELPNHMISQIHRFFEDYKKLENKEVKVKSFEDREHALGIINKSIEMYKKEFPDYIPKSEWYQRFQILINLWLNLLISKELYIYVE